MEWKWVSDDNYWSMYTMSYVHNLSKVMTKCIPTND